MSNKRDIAELASAALVGSATGIIKNMKDAPQFIHNLNSAEVGLAYCAALAGLEFMDRCKEVGFRNALSAVGNATVTEFSGFAYRNMLRLAGALFGDVMGTEYFSPVVNKCLESLTESPAAIAITKQT